MNMKNPFLFAITALIFIASPLLAQDAKPAASAKDAKPATSGKDAKPAAAGDDKASLANQATNPAAPLIQFQLQNTFEPSNRGASGYGNIFKIQPVIPFSIGEDRYFQNIITRTSLPILTSANPDGAMTSVTGLGDTVIVAILAHRAKISKELGYVWGPVAATSLPTATSDRTGNDKYSLGGGGLLMFSKQNLFTNGDTVQFGVWGYNLWSVAGRDSRSNVSTFFASPILNYHFSEFLGQKGWYLRWTDELQNYDWKAGGSDTAAIPVGGALGKVFAIGKHNVNVFLGGNYNAAYRSGPGERWNIKLNVTLLLPK
jgi:hypothetical protein